MKKNSNVLEREVAGETVLLNTESGRYLVLNETASFIWARLERLGPEDLVEELCAHFSVPTEQAQAGLERFMNSMAAEDMVDAQAPAQL